MEFKIDINWDEGVPGRWEVALKVDGHTRANWVVDSYKEAMDFAAAMWRAAEATREAICGALPAGVYGYHQHPLGYSPAAQERIKFEGGEE